MPLPSAPGGNYMGSYRPQYFSWDQVRTGAAGPLYTPPPEPAGSSPAPAKNPPSPPEHFTLPRPWDFRRTPAPRTVPRAGTLGASGGAGGSFSSGGGGGAASVAAPPPPRLPAAPNLPGGSAPAFTPGANPAAYSGDYSGAENALNSLRSRVKIPTGGRAELGGPSADNVWETLALEKFGAGFDPGTMFEGKDLADTVFNEAQINQMAQQRAAPTLRALRDADTEFAAAAGRGGSYSPAMRAAMAARARVEGAGAIGSATRDAQLDAASANAAQAIAARENARQNFNTDIAGRLGLGNLNLNAAGDVLNAGLQRRTLDQNRDVSRFEGDITQRGQDIGARTSAATLNNARDLARESGTRDLAQLRDQTALTQRGQDIGRANEIDQGRLTERGQDINRETTLGSLGLEKFKTEADFANAQAERQNRAALLDAQLTDQSLDRNTRAQLERERMQLDREMRQAELEQNNAQFAQRLGLDTRQLEQSGGQFDRSLAENSRQFDAGQQLTREQGSLTRDLTRYLNPPTPAGPSTSDMQRMIQSSLEQILRRRDDMGGGQISMDELQRLLAQQAMMN